MLDKEPVPDMADDTQPPNIHHTTTNRIDSDDAAAWAQLGIGGARLPDSRARRRARRNPITPLDSPLFAYQSAFRSAERAFKRRGPVAVLPDQLRASIIDPRRVVDAATAAKLETHANAEPSAATSFDADEALGLGAAIGAAVVRLDHPAKFSELFGSGGGGAVDPGFLDAVVFAAHPGLIVLPRAFHSPDAECRAIRACLADWTRRPNVSNLDTHYVVGGGDRGLWGIHSDEWVERRRRRHAANGVGGGEGADLVVPDTLLERRQWAAGSATRDTRYAESTTADAPASSVAAAVNAADGALAIDPPSSPMPQLVPMRVSEAVRAWRWSSVGQQCNWTVARRTVLLP
ncbi:hypothetical protein HK405_011396 [Cladochytrium tenue]|nr:hypothetical protein HK405_011396 [Cladochytrium tenue]